MFRSRRKRERGKGAGQIFVSRYMIYIYICKEGRKEGRGVCLFVVVVMYDVVSECFLLHMYNTYFFYFYHKKGWLMCGGGGGKWKDFGPRKKKKKRWGDNDLNLNFFFFFFFLYKTNPLPPPLPFLSSHRPTQSIRQGVCFDLSYIIIYTHAIGLFFFFFFLKNTITYLNNMRALSLLFRSTFLLFF